MHGWGMKFLSEFKKKIKPDARTSERFSRGPGWELCARKNRVGQSY